MFSRRTNRTNRFRKRTATSRRQWSTRRNPGGGGYSARPRHGYARRAARLAPRSKWAGSLTRHVLRGRQAGGQAGAEVHAGVHAAVAGGGAAPRHKAAAAAARRRRKNRVEIAGARALLRLVHEIARWWGYDSVTLRLRLRHAPAGVSRCPGTAD
eukprot:853549-Prorocentrum_minimum.AAC.1